MRKLRRSSEAEVISEFLKNEFYHEEFHSIRASYERLVLDADLGNEEENAMRRALLFRRRGHMWRELPDGTDWWQVELDPDDLDFVRVFPRAQWRRLAGDSYLLRDMVNRIRSVRSSGSRGSFISRVQGLSYRLREERDRTAVMLIGIDEEHALTILEGNHRLTAALLAGPEVFYGQFRIFCGFSPAMRRCCWYETNVENLWRYAQNRLRNLLYDADADVHRVRHGPVMDATVLEDAGERIRKPVGTK